MVLLTMSENILQKRSRVVVFPKSLKPDHEKISAYYNLDNGTGKVRGIYAQGNEDVVPIFREWLDEFKDLGANTITLENTGGTDHLGFDGVGIPGFQFIQEPIPDILTEPTIPIWTIGITW